MILINLKLFDKDSRVGKAIKYHAITIGIFVFVFIKNPSKTLIAHERVHVKQFLSDPILFYPKYLYYFIKNLFIYKDWYTAYYNIPYEIEARNEAYKEKIGR